MRGTHILAFTSSALWALFLVAGISLVHGPEANQMPGFPSAGQLRYYIYIPAGVLLLIAIAWGIAARGYLKVLAIVVCVLALFAFPIYFLGFTGGV